MKRRDFLRTGTTASLAGLTVSRSPHVSALKSAGPYFDVHRHIKDHPDAVYIYHTDVQSKKDSDTLYQSGLSLADQLISESRISGYTAPSRVLIKPNWTDGQLNDRVKDFDILGIHTDLDFLQGWVHGLQGRGINQLYIRDCARPSKWQPLGYREFADRNNIDLKDLSSGDIWSYGENDTVLMPVNNGVVFNEVGFMSPANKAGTFVINIAKLKSHGMGITAAVKNLQGLCAHTFHTFCMQYDKVRETSDSKYHKFFCDGFEKRIESLHAKHVNDGISRWDRPGEKGGIWMEQWVQRMLDSLSVTHTNLNIVEGIYAHEGDGLGRGPNGRGQDYMYNTIIFGIDPLRVDLVAFWLAGHNPKNFGLFHIARERGMLDVIDPYDVPLFQWKVDDQPQQISLDTVKRQPLLTYYLTRDYGRGREPAYHLVDEE